MTQSKSDGAMFRAIVTLAFVCCYQIALADDLKPFTTDGCSDFPNGTPSQKSLWLNCCIRHDLAYWKGGTQAERFNADYALQNCVAQTGEVKIAQLMLAGVRVGGSPFYPTSYRWGYGWPYLRGYQALSVEEKTQVKAQIQRLVAMLRDFSAQLE
jgi:hypothetical protein